jgi:molecular chaperone DnaK/molecular chaperone HscA
MMDTEVMGAMKGQTMEAAGAGMGEAPTAPHPFAKAEFDERPSTDDTDPTD